MSNFKKEIIEARKSLDEREKFWKSYQGKMEYIKNYLENNSGKNGFHTKMNKERNDAK